MSKIATLWYVYLLRCQNQCGGSGAERIQTILYCGIAKNVSDRLYAHQQGIGAKYTKGRYCELVVSAGPFTKSTALKIEAKIKKYRASEKIQRLDDYNKHEGPYIGSL